MAVPAGYGNENGKLRKQAMQEESRKEKNFIKRIYHAEAPKWLKYAILFGYPVLLFYITALMTYNPFVRTRWRAQILNLLLFEAFVWLLLAITGSAVIALRTETILGIALSIANYYVISFRGSPVVPWDLMSLGTAASVAGSYDYTLPPRQIALILLMLFLAFTECYAKIHISRKKILLRAGSAVISIACMAGIGWMVQDDAMVSELQLYPFLFTPTVMYERNGFAVTFLMDMQYLKVEKPEGYSVEKAKELLENEDGLDWTASDQRNNVGKEFANQKETTGQLPNVIVIMDEAFSDLGVLSDEALTVNEDYMPFIHSLQQGAENAQTGYLNVSVKGGNTANTEFEFLTGDTMAFLPAGSIPYQQYITKDTPSIASYLKSLGYETYAMHPYYASGWNRDKIYPLLGFDSFYSSTDFYGSTYERGYIDDSSCVDKIIETYEKKDAGTPAFIFNVTMQNHSPYTDGYQNLQGNVTVDGTVSAQLSEYLTLVKLSDAALEKLIDYFEAQDEPTVIVFFGDHQPTDAVVEPIWNLEGKSSSDLTEEENQLRYKVPYVIWANYDIDEAVNQESSANYLGAQMMEAAGIPLSDYQNYLLEQKKEMPLISTQHTEAEGSDAWLNYQTLQYYLLFDWDGEK